MQLFSNKDKNMMIFECALTGHIWTLHSPKKITKKQYTKWTKIITDEWATLVYSKFSKEKFK